MVRRTFGQVKTALSRIAGQTGVPVDDALLLGYVNDAIEELANEGDWPGVVDRWHFRFNQATSLVTLPSFLERLIGVTVDDVPLEIRSPWYEFVQYGPGIQRELDADRASRRSWVSVVMDRGEICTQFPLPATGGPWTLCLRSLQQESATAQVNLQGLDEGGNIVRTFTDGTNGEPGDWITGENLTLSDGTSEVCTTSLFSALTAVVKPVTNGPLVLSATDGTTTLQLSTYQFDEINPSYRQYFIPQLYRQNTTDYANRVILARCRRRFVPALSDNDTLMIGNVLALQEMLIAQWSRTVPDLQQYQAHKLTAIDIMRKEAMAHMGKSRTPSLTFSRGYGIGSSLQYLR